MTGPRTIVIEYPADLDVLHDCLLDNDMEKEAACVRRMIREGRFPQDGTKAGSKYHFNASGWYLIRDPENVVPGPEDLPFDSLPKDVLNWRMFPDSTIAIWAVIDNGTYF